MLSWKYIPYRQAMNWTTIVYQKTAQRDSVLGQSSSPCLISVSSSQKDPVAGQDSLHSCLSIAVTTVINELKNNNLKADARYSIAAVRKPTPAQLGCCEITQDSWRHS